MKVETIRRGLMTLLLLALAVMVLMLVIGWLDQRGRAGKQKEILEKVTAQMQQRSRQKKSQRDMLPTAFVSSRPLRQADIDRFIKVTEKQCELRNTVFKGKSGVETQALRKALNDSEMSFLEYSTLLSRIGPAMVLAHQQLELEPQVQKLRRKLEDLLNDPNCSKVDRERYEKQLNALNSLPKIEEQVGSKLSREDLDLVSKNYDRLKKVFAELSLNSPSKQGQNARAFGQVSPAASGAEKENGPTVTGPTNPADQEQKETGQAKKMNSPKE